MSNDLGGCIPPSMIPSVTALIAFFIGLIFMAAGDNQRVAICWGYALAVIGVKSPLDFATPGYAIKGAVGGVVLILGLVNPLGMLG